MMIKSELEKAPHIIGNKYTKEIPYIIPYMILWIIMYQIPYIIRLHPMEKTTWYIIIHSFHIEFTNRAIPWVAAWVDL